jgi:NADH dehydrogenase
MTLLKLYRAVDPANIKIVIVEMGPRIAGELHTRLGAYLVKHLEHIGVELRLKSRVTRVREHSIEINGAQDVPTRTLIWVVGVAANPRIAELPLEKDWMGRVIVNEYGEVKGFHGVYAVGDCAHFTETATGKAVQPRAHAAVREARLVAHNLLASIRGRDKKPFRYADTTEIVSLGASKAVFRFHGLRLYGLPARVIWLLGYSLLITGAYNRIRIIMDWTLALVFGRDTTLVTRGK